MENTFFLSKKVDFLGKSLPLANLTALTSPDFGDASPCSRVRLLV